MVPRSDGTKPAPGNTIRVVGHDPSLRNWGVASADYDLLSGSLTNVVLDLIQPVVKAGKSVRQNSKDLQAVTQLATKAFALSAGAQVIFVECPVGSQSSRAMVSYGVCVGILGTMRARGISFFELTALEIKLAATGYRDATKKQMIDWGTGTWPQANWPVYKGREGLMLSESKAEHMADALGAVVAGLQSEQFRQLLPLLLNERALSGAETGN